MHEWRKRPRGIIVGAAAITALALASAGCSSSPKSAPANAVVKGGVATYPMIGVGANWIWPYIPPSNYSLINQQLFQWLMYRPLYFFGNDGNSITVNYHMSTAYPPVYENGGKTVVVNLKGWKWSDGETVDARDVMFWLNMMKAEPAGYAGYAPGLLPDNLVSYKITGPLQITLHLNRGYSSYWYTYNQLAEITPMPLAWDVTSLTGAPGSGGCASSVAKCAAVFKFLTAQAMSYKTYATSKLWGVVDGPWRLSAFSLNKLTTFVPNRAYSGSPKPHLAKLLMKTFADETTQYTALQHGQVSAGFVPVTSLPQRAAGSQLPATNPLGKRYKLAPFYQSTIYYYVLNYNNPVLGPVFRQLYVRQALQYTMDQPTIDTSVFHGYAVPGAGAVPTAPANQWEPAIQQANGGQGPYPFSIATAKSLLTSHGWREVNKVMTCERPGTAASDCGAGIPAGRKLAFRFDWLIGLAETPQMLAVYQADAASAGIRITTKAEPAETAFAEAAPCKPGPKCSWDALYDGNWVFNGPGFEPTGESLFETGAGENSGSYSNPAEDKLINLTHTSDSLAIFHQYATYTDQQLPAIWLPDQYTIVAISSKLSGVHFSPLYTFVPEYWYFRK